MFSRVDSGAKCGSPARWIERLEVRQLLSAGQLDPHYGDSGITRLADTGGYERSDYTDHENLATWQGKTLLAHLLQRRDADYQPIGQPKLGVFRETADGKPDKSFSGTGVVFRDGDFTPIDIAVATDGRVAVAAIQSSNSPNHRSVVLMFSADGHIDKSFSGDGMALPPNGAYAVAFAADGKLIVAGSDSVSGIAASRFTRAGQLDKTFGGGDGVGEVLTPFWAGVSDVAIRTDGAIAMIGTSGADFWDGGYTDFGVGVLTSDGKPDQQFGTHGWEQFDTAFDENAGAITALPNNRLLIGAASSEVRPIASVLDSHGEEVLSMGTPDEYFAPYVTSVGVGPDGKFYMSFYDNSVRSYAARFNANGTLDTNFGDDHTGVIQTDGRISRVQSDGTLVTGAAGYLTRPGPDARPAVLSADGTLTITALPTVYDQIDVSPSDSSPHPAFIDVSSNFYDKRFDGSKVKRIVFRSGNLQDLVYIGVDLPTTMYGGSGADYFTAVGPAVMYGNGGNDELRGGAHDDQLFGGAGNDTIIGGLGSDTMYGGAGSDTLNYFEHMNAVTVRLGHAGSDYGSAGEHDFAAADFENATGGNGNDILIGTDADNVLSGGSGNDYIEGRGGDDKLAGNAGADTLVGGDGNDTFDASDYDYNGAGDTKMPDIFRGGAGIDTVTYASANRSDRMSLSLDNIANDGLSGERDNLIDIENVTGGDGDDTIIGSDKGNVLRGGPSNVPDGGDNDFIYGLGGNDILIGGRGKDLLVGGAGDDVIWSVDGSSGDRIDGGAGFDRAAFDKDKDAVLNIEKFI